MTWELDINNIAGILDGHTTIEPGLNAVRAENWQGKSSFVLAIEAAMGTKSPLTDGVTDGSVNLETPEKDVTVSFSRSNGRVTRNGTPYLEAEYDRTCASLYAFLTEQNPVRNAVQNDENLEEYLTKPLELENIDEQISELQSERDRVDTELQRAESAAEKLVTKEKTVTSLEQKLEELRSEKEDIDRPSDEQGSRDELSDARAKRESLRGQIERLEDTIERIEERLSERRSELDELEVPEYTSVEEDLQKLSEKLQNAETDKELLQSVYTANKRVLDEDRVDLLTGVDRGLLEDSVDCWVCGSETSRGTIETQLDAIQEEIRELEEDANAYRREMGSLEEKKEERRTKQRRVSTLEDEIGDLETKLEERRDSLQRKQESLSSVEDSVSTLEETVNEQEDELTEIESEIKYTEEKLSNVREEIETLETRSQQRSTLEEERESLSDEIESLRTRRESMKSRTREAFSESITEIIDKFNTSYESARLTSNFDLVVARDGREVSLDALSEGEVVLLGLVAALAGFEAYNVEERVPVILVDSLGGLTDRNLHRLMDYLMARSDRVVCTAFPEQSSFGDHEIDPTEWDVVSDRSTVDLAS